MVFTNTKAQFLDKLKREKPIDFDTSYISKLESKFSVKITSKITGTNVETITKDDNDIERKVHLDSKNSMKFSAKISYKSFIFGFSINPYAIKHGKKDVEYSLSHYAKRYGFDVVLQNNKTLHGHWEYGDNMRDTIPEGVVNQKAIYTDFFWTLNYKKFSFPAAFNQSYIQKRSAGSWLLGASFFTTKVKTNEDYTEKGELNLVNFSLGGGYGYNWVLGKNKKFLIHISSIPTIVVYDHTNFVVNDERANMEISFFKYNFTSRAAFTYNFNHWFMSATAVSMLSSTGADTKIHLQNNRTQLKYTIGYRF